MPPASIDFDLSLRLDFDMSPAAMMIISQSRCGRAMPVARRRISLLQQVTDWPAAAKPAKVDSSISRLLIDDMPSRTRARAGARADGEPRAEDGHAPRYSHERRRARARVHATRHQEGYAGHANELNGHDDRKISTPAYLHCFLISLKILLSRHRDAAADRFGYAKTLPHDGSHRSPCQHPTSPHARKPISLMRRKRAAR